MEARLALIGRKGEVTRLFGTCDERVRLLCESVEHFSMDRVRQHEMVAVVRMTKQARAARRASVGGVPASSRAFFYHCYPLQDLATWMVHHDTLPRNRATLAPDDRVQLLAAAGMQRPDEDDVLQLDDLTRLAIEDLDTSGDTVDLDELTNMLLREP